MSKLIILLAALMVLLTELSSFAAQVRVFVADMNATGVQNRDEIKMTLHTLLSSRLNSAKIEVVGSATEADAVVSGTYTSIGNNYSLDAIARTSTGKTLAMAFVQGKSEDELIPAIGTLAEKLSIGIAEGYARIQANTFGQHPSQETAPKVISDKLLSTTNETQVKPGISGNIIKPPAQEPVTRPGSQLNGAANLMAAGMITKDGRREIFLAGNKRLSYYLQGSDMQLMSDVQVSSTEKILSLDTLEGSDGKLDIYVTIIRAGELASQVWQVNEGKLLLVAENLPYFFRSMSLLGGTKKLYAQAMGRNDDFYGNIYEATRNGSVITIKNPLKMPHYGTIYNFNQFRDRDGKQLTVILDPDGHLVVYDQQMVALWQSKDRFGGSELYFQKEDYSNVRSTGDGYRMVFMDQRVHVLSSGEILVGKNDGLWVIGNFHSYDKGMVYCLVWSGLKLEEKWHTRETENYMPDYLFDETRKEMLILQTVKRVGTFSQGASSLLIKKIE